MKKIKGHSQKRKPSGIGPKTASIPNVPEDAVEKTSRQDLLFLALITLCGFALRIYNVGFREAHLDESFNMRVVRAPLLKDFISALFTVDCHPPISYLIQKVFYWLSPTLDSVRISSVLIGTLAIPAIFWAFRPVLGRHISLASSFIAATSFILVWYSRVARNYALFFAVAVLVFGFFVRLLAEQTSGRVYYRNLVGFSLALLACLYTHHTAMLMLPILALLYGAWEIMHHQFRWRLMKHLILIGILVGICTVPLLYQLQAWSSDHFANDRQRPSASQLIDILASLGWGKEWRLVLWSLILMGGFFSIRHRSPPVAVVFAGWAIAPFAIYLLLIGMPTKFIWFFYRYVIFIQIGLIALIAACGIFIAQKLDSVRLFNRRVFPFTSVILLLIAVRVGILWAPYVPFYRMKATKQIREQVITGFRSVPFQRILCDNFYFVDVALRQYKPRDIRVTYPPGFNNAEDYAQVRVAPFIRESCQNDPFLGFYETGAREYGQPDTSWEWLDRHFAKKKPMFNKEGYELAQMGLNYFTYLDISSYFACCLYYNTFEDLPAWYARKGQTLGAGFAEGWHPITIYNSASKMWYCMEQESKLYLFNAGPPEVVTLLFDAQSCAPIQHLTIDQDRNRLFDLDLNIPPPKVNFFNGDPSIHAYVTFSRLLQLNDGIMPLEAGFQFTPGLAETLPFIVPPGLSFLSLRSSGKEGLLISELILQKTAHPSAFPATPQEGEKKQP